VRSEGETSGKGEGVKGRKGEEGRRSEGVKGRRGEGTMVNTLIICSKP